MNASLTSQKYGQQPLGHCAIAGQGELEVDKPTSSMAAQLLIQSRRFCEFANVIMHCSRAQLHVAYGKKAADTTPFSLLQVLTGDQYPRRA